MKTRLSKENTQIQYCHEHETSVLKKRIEKSSRKFQLVAIKKYEETFVLFFKQIFEITS